MLENLKENGVNVKLIFVVIIFIFLLLLFIIFGTKSGGYMIINENLILTKKGNEWSQIKKINDSLFKKEYSVYSSKGNTDGVTINYSNNNFYYYDKMYKDLNLNKVSVAYTKEFKNIKVADYDVSFYDNSDDLYMQDILKDRDISNFKNSVIKSSFDLDSDGISENIYTMTNMSLAGENEKNYSSIFLVKNDKVIDVLDDDTSQPYLVQNIIDLDGDGKYEVVVSKGTIDNPTFSTCGQIYKISGSKIKRIKDC